MIERETPDVLVLHCVYVIRERDESLWARLPHSTRALPVEPCHEPDELIRMRTQPAHQHPALKREEPPPRLDRVPKLSDLPIRAVQSHSDKPSTWEQRPVHPRPFVY